MPPIKPIVDDSSLRALLAQQFDAPVTGVHAIDGGSVAQTFLFDANGGAYVIRFNADNMDANYEKEAFITAKYGSARVPIPEIIRVGRLGELHYVITKKAAGRGLDKLSADEMAEAMPSVTDTLHAIHANDVSREEGYRVFDGRGVGFFPSWTAYLMSIREEERSDGFYGKWHTMFETTFLERAVFDRVFATMESLLPYCPTDRYLVHGGYAYGNVLVANGLLGYRARLS